MINTEDFMSIIQQAISSTSEGITIADASIPDVPIIFANRAFYKITGYTEEETIGKNCRFLQGEKTDKEAVLKIKTCLAEKRECITELLNYKKDGTPFWNRLCLVPILNSEGKVTHFVGLQSDITEAKKADRAKAQLKAMQVTMNSVNDIVLNFMSNLQFFKMELEDKLEENNEIIENFDEMFTVTKDRLSRLNSLKEFEATYEGAKPFIKTEY